MKVRLYDRKLVGKLKRAAKERVRREGRKSAKGKWWKRQGGSASKWWWVLILLNAARAGVASGAKGGAIPTVWLCCASLVFAGVALSQARKLWGKLTVESERLVLFYYPLEEKDFFEWTALRVAARQMWVLAVAAGLYVFAVRMGGGSGWLLGLVGALAEWLVVVCIALGLVRHVDKYPRWLPLGLYAAGALLLVMPGQFGATMEPLGWMLPTGWVHLLLSAKIGEEWAEVGMVAAAMGLGALGWWMWRELGAFYCQVQTPVVIESEDAPGVEEPVRPEVKMETLIEGTEEDEEEEEAALPIQATWRKQRLDNLSVRAGQYVAQENWIEGWNWNALGPIERAAGWCLNTREKSEAQFLLGPKAPNWSGRWKIAVIATAAAFAAVLPGIVQLNMLAAVGLGVAIGSGLPILGGLWPATNQGRISGKFSPTFGCYPLSYWTAGWTMYKLNGVRTVAWLPLGLMIGILGARSSHVPLGEGCWVTARAILLFQAVMPLLVAGKFSKVTNDTVSLRLRTLPVIGAALVVLGVVITLGTMAMFAPGALALAFLAGVAATTWGAWWLYGVYYERGRVDLLREQR